MAKIVIDAGHGRYGNKSPNNAKYTEGTQMWHLGVYLEKALTRMGHEVIMTRPNINDDPTLPQRGAMGKGADILLSLHSNAPAMNDNGTYNKDVTGTVTFYSLLHPDTKALAEGLGMKVSEMMGHHFRGAQTRESDTPGLDYYGVIRSAALVKCPAIIIEHGFHTNISDSEYLLDDENLKALAEAEAEIIGNHFTIGWSDEAVKWATENGILRGKDNGELKLEDACTREELVTMLHRFYKLIKGE